MKHELLYYQGTIIEIKNRIKLTVTEMKTTYGAIDIDKENGMYFVPLELIEMFIDVYVLLFPDEPKPQFQPSDINTTNINYPKDYDKIPNC